MENDNFDNFDNFDDNENIVTPEDVKAMAEAQKWINSLSKQEWLDYAKRMKNLVDVAELNMKFTTPNYNSKNVIDAIHNKKFEN